LWIEENIASKGQADVSKVFKRFSEILTFAIVMIIILPCSSCKEKPVPAAYAQTQNSSDTNRTKSVTDKANQALPGGSENKPPLRPTHKHAAFRERQTERVSMVDWQIHRRGITDPNVLVALKTVPRHAFVQSRDLRQAYNDHPLPIGSGQTISQPYIVGYMTEALNLKPNFKVLEIGTGSGYQAAVCAEIISQVNTIEIIEALAKSAQKRLKELGYENVFVKNADGYFGWKEEAPFDAIIITCAAGFVPPPLIEQLKPGGIMVLPLGSPFGYQVLVMVTKDHKGKTSSKELLPVRFVPMLGRSERGR
jgi:protein-L-isoaspartate(D-aspartate) O-methyltransferase